MCGRGTSGVITNDTETFRLQDLKLKIVGRRCIAPDSNFSNGIVFHGGNAGIVMSCALY